MKPDFRHFSPAILLENRNYVQVFHALLNILPNVKYFLIFALLNHNHHRSKMSVQPNKLHSEYCIHMKKRCKKEKWIRNPRKPTKTLYFLPRKWLRVCVWELEEDDVDKNRQRREIRKKSAHKMYKFVHQ